MTKWQDNGTPRAEQREPFSAVSNADVVSLTVTSSRVNDAVDRSIDRDVPGTS